MQTFQHVEDYLELLAGYQIHSGNSSLIWISPPNTAQFSLARYDVNIVNNMAANTLTGTALTDRQAELVIKLILKYTRQFAKLGIDVSQIETNPQFRVAPRKIDRIRAITLEEGSIKVKFPYDNQMIEQVREFKEVSQGQAVWYANDKTWLFGLTEYNVSWLVTWGELNQFTIDDEVKIMFDQILKVEQTPYEIKLVKTSTGYEITNAANSLKEYVDQQCGQDLVKLVDYSGVLGYTIDADLLEYCSKEYGPALEHLGCRRKLHLNPASDHNLWDWVLDYAALTNRYPICVYDPGMFEFDLSRFSSDEIVRFDQNGKTSRSDYDPQGVKLVYARRIPQTWDSPVPLLVTTAEMMYGGKKLDWLNRAEKIVYWTKAMLNEKPKWQ